MKKYIFLILLFLSVAFAKAQKKDSDVYKLIVTLENAPFDSLFLQDYTDDKSILFPGEKTAEFTWTIEVPDSIVNNFEFMNLVVSLYDSTDNSSTSVRFIKKAEGNDVIVANVGIEDKVNRIYGSYMDKTILPDEKIRVKINDKDSLVIADLVLEDFELKLENDSSDITIRSQEPFFSWFMPSGEENKSYEDYLAYYIDLSRRYPDSRYLISYLSQSLNNYKSKEDVRLVYENFSDKHRFSKWGRKIEGFLKGSFQNKELYNLAEESHQRIIQDSLKYNLIVFSASYCIPCIEEIPLLKEISKDLEKELIVTYISLDRKKDFERFEKLLIDHEILWRSLYAYENLQDVYDAYYINGIPHNILVHPDGQMEILDVRKEEQKRWLYTEVLSSE